MATLYVRDIPDEMYQTAQAIAAERQVSLNAYITSLLQEAISREQARTATKNALQGLRHRRRKLPPKAPDAVELVRHLRSEMRGKV
jgi:plasmid stability protein